MPSKRKNRRTNEQRKADEKAALRRRVLDMAYGAFGWYQGAEALDPDHPEHTGMFGGLSPDALGRWIGAVAIHLMRVDRDKADFMLLPHTLANWDNLDEVVDMLYARGVRA